VTRHQGNSLTDLGVFSLGVSVLLYSFMQYFFTPLCWWLAQHIEQLAWMNDIFVFYEMKGLDVFTGESLSYSALGIGAFFCGYLVFPARLAKIRGSLISREWDLRKAERIFWLLFLSGFAIKAIKVMAGANVPGIVEASIKHSLIPNPFVVFFLSFNWFHMVGLVVINIAYQESKKSHHPDARRLRVLAYATNVFVLAVSLSTGGQAATLVPLLSLLIVRQFYVSRRTPMLSFVWRTMLFIIAIFFIKYIISEMFPSQAEAAGVGESAGFRFSLFYLLFYRVNMSEVVAAVIEKGQQAFPDGTLGQFWVDMSLYGNERINVFDGNEFGRAMGIAAPGDYATGVAATNMGELYINFGLAGILLGMLLTGVLYRVFFSTCRQRLPAFVLLYALMWPILIHGIESPITVLFSTSIKMILLCLIVHLAITWKLTARTHHSRFAATPDSLAERPPAISN